MTEDEVDKFLTDLSVRVEMACQPISMSMALNETHLQDMMLDRMKEMRILLREMQGIIEEGLSNDRG